MSPLRAVFVVLACVLAFSAGAEEKLGKVDRMRIVGTPVLSQAARGIHVWLEDGWYRVAAVSALPVGGAKKRTRTFSVSIRSSKPFGKVELFQWKRTGGGEESVSMRVLAGPDPEIMRFQTDGELTISGAGVDGEEAAIYVGPTSKPSASVLRIGRY